MIKALLVGQLTWNKPLFLLGAILTVAYLIYIKKHPVVHQLRQSVFFILGIWLLYAAVGSPLLAISYLSFSFHMIQMSFLFFIIPPLILLGIPPSLYKKILTVRFVKKIRTYWLSPKGALILFAVLFLCYHLPFILTSISQVPMLQKLYITVLFILAFQMVWPIASPDPEERLSKSARNKYILQSSLYIMPACLLFIASALLEGMSNPFLAQATTHLCLPADSTIQVLPPPFNTKYDQVLAGFFMLGLHKFGLMFTSKLEVKW